MSTDTDPDDPTPSDDPLDYYDPDDPDDHPPYRVGHAPGW